MRSLVIVAHPGDEAELFGGHILASSDKYEWRVISVFGDRQRETALQAKQAMKIRDYQIWGFSEDSFAGEVQNILSAYETNWHKVYTHSIADHDPKKRMVALAAAQKFGTVFSYSLGILPTNNFEVGQHYDRKLSVVRDIYNRSYASFYEPTTELRTADAAFIYSRISGEDKKFYSANYLKVLRQNAISLLKKSVHDPSSIAEKGTPFLHQDISEAYKAARIKSGHNDMEQTDVLVVSDYHLDGSPNARFVLLIGTKSVVQFNLLNLFRDGEWNFIGETLVQKKTERIQVTPTSVPFFETNEERIIALVEHKDGFEMSGGFQ